MSERNRFCVRRRGEVLPHRLIHIEVVHPDPEAASQYMIDVLGAERVERQLAAKVEQLIPGINLAHVRLSNVVFQFVQPNEHLASWKAQLDREGPSVHNISMTIEGIGSVVDEMQQRGGKILLDMDVDLQSALGYSDEPTFRGCVVDARQQAGLVFEMFDERCGWVGGEPA
jgi:hypothetical protein